MPAMRLDHVTVEFPVYQAGARSLRKILIANSTKGNLARDARDRVNVLALRDICLDIPTGERIGVIGANGAGKTTLLKVMAGIYKPTQGRAHIQGRAMALINASVGLSPDATGRENIILRGLYMDIHPRQMREQIERVAEFTELGSYLDMPVRTYSSGMMVRLAFAISTCIRPEILILDEWLAGSSVVVLASHSLDLVREWCRRAIYLREGVAEAIGPVDEVVDMYRRAAA
jgi:ABC-2 type transport system ATP-binding protein/lipopolysaccharide transport system ATP-binding protein